MRYIHVLLVVVSVFGLPSLAEAQRTPVERDPRSVAALTAAMRTLGWSGPFQHNDAVADGSFEPTADSLVLRGTFVWKCSWAGNLYQFRKEMLTGNERSIVVSGDGSPAASHRGFHVVLPESALSVPPFHLPALSIALMLQNPLYSIRPPARAELRDGTVAMQVHAEIVTDDLELRDASQQDWFLDPGTLIPIRLDYWEPTAADPKAVGVGPELVKIEITYEDFRPIDVTLVPFRMAMRLQARPLGVFVLNSIAFNQSLSPSEFRTTSR